MCELWKQMPAHSSLKYSHWKLSCLPYFSILLSFLFCYKLLLSLHSNNNQAQLQDSLELNVRVAPKKSNYFSLFHILFRNSFILMENLKMMKYSKNCLFTILLIKMNSNQYILNEVLIIYLNFLLKEQEGRTTRRKMIREISFSDNVRLF